jgi:hypothetical protein
MRTLSYLTILTLGVLVIASAAFADFTEEAQFGTGTILSIAWGDYDNDGDLDVAAGTSAGQNYLYVNNGDDTFTEEAQFGTSDTRSVTWGDYDNDGDLDLAAGNASNQQNYLYVNDGDGTFTEETQFGTGDTRSISWGDYDNDGDLDLALGHVGQNSLFTNNGDGTFNGEAQFGTGSTYMVAWCDYDDDGDLDVAVGNRGQSYLYVNNGDGTFTEDAQLGTGETFSLAWGDYDNDGDADVAVGNCYDQQNYLYINIAGTGFASQAQFGTGHTDSVAWGDYDNDGDLDLAVANSNNQQNYLYINNGDGTFTADAQFGTRYTGSVAWGDYDNDGDLDLAVGNYNNQQSYLYINNEDDDDYLSLHLVGHHHDQGSGYSDRDGIGAKVLAYEVGYLGDEDHLLGFREVEANGGYSGQDSINAEFGLPTDDTVEVRIIWPGSGGSNITQDIIADKTQFITVHEADEFHLLSPADGEDVGGFPLTLDWEDAFATDLAGYTVQIATDADFADSVYTVDVTDSEVALDEGSGLTNGTYYWRVIANYEGTPGDYSRYSAESWSFTLTEVDIALLYFEATSDGRGISLSWDVNATEDTEIAGFNLYRSAASGGATTKTITSRDKLNAKLITGGSPYTYLDAAVEESVTYSYWLEAVDVGGASETFGPVECTWNGSLPTAYALYQSRPNPATGNATIAFDLPEDAKVTLTVYDISGRKVTTLVDDTLTIGKHEAEVSGLAPGVYVYRLTAGDYTAARKMVVVE